MENWIGIGIWIVLGGLIGLAMKSLVRRPEGTPGHKRIIMALGAFAAVVGGMLGVGIFSFRDRFHQWAAAAITSVGGMAGAVFLALLFTFVYRWGIRSLI